jgi:hypothetical protein
MSKACKHAIGWQTKSCCWSETGSHTPANDQNKLSWLPGEASETAGLDHSLVPRTDQLHSHPRPNLAKSDPIPLPLRLHLRFWTQTTKKLSATTYLVKGQQRSRSDSVPSASLAPINVHPAWDLHGNKVSGRQTNKGSNQESGNERNSNLSMPWALPSLWPHHMPPQLCYRHTMC